MGHDHGAHGAHSHTHEDGVPPTGAELDALYSQEYWDERYRTGENAWSGNPNPQLASRVGALPPGRALEAGSGDGSDAIWLAQQGWDVDAVDVSQVALDQAAARAAALGVGDRLTWRQADLRSWAPEESAYDLVTAFFVHIPGLDELNRRLAAAVRPGGTLLIVLHHPSHYAHTGGRWGGPEMFRSADEVAATLDPADWDVTAEEPTRAANRPQMDGHMQDSIVLATRRA